MQHAAVWHLYLLLYIYIIFLNFLLFLSIFFFLNTFLKSGIDKSMEWSRIPACSSLKCFLTGAIPEGLILRKIFCLTFVYVFFYVNLCQDFVGFREFVV